MERRNKGFSLIELIVVIALMAVGLTVSSYSLATISLANAKNCATEIESTLEVARTETVRTVSGKEPQVSVYVDNDGNVMMKAGSNSAEKIGGSSVKIKYKVQGADTYTTLTKDSEALVFSFDRSTGGFNKCPCTEMIVSGAGKEYTITCYAKTGKVTLD